MAKHVLTKLDPKVILEEGARTQQVYKLKPSWRRYMRFAAILTCLLVITLPLGIWMYIVAGKAHVALGQEGLALKLFGTKAWAWTDIEKFDVSSLSGSAMGGGLIGIALASAVSARTDGLKGPLMMKLKGRKMPVQIPAHQIDGSVAMAREIEARTGLSIFPPETAKAAKAA